MPTKTLKDLFIHSLSDIYSAEKQMTKSLPKMAPSSAMALPLNLRIAHRSETAPDPPKRALASLRKRIL